MKTQHNRRRFERFDSTHFVEFKKAGATNRYYLGLTKNFSAEGFCMEFHNFLLEAGERIEFKLKHPQNKFSVFFIGDVAWKEYIDNKCLAGVIFREVNNRGKKKILDIICTNRKVPSRKFLKDKAHVSRIRKRVLPF